MPVLALVVTVVVTLIFLLVGRINTLAPIVTMPYLATYAAIDYAYFALAMTADLQRAREARFRWVGEGGERGDGMVHRMIKK